MDTLKPIISLSTSLLQNRFPNDGYAMLCRARELGFEYVELGHSTAPTSVEGILKALAEGVVKVSSLHNFCPVPPFAAGASPNLYSPSTKSAAESQQWLRHTGNTLEFAKLTGAKAVVNHSGALSYFLFRPDAKISALIDAQELPKLEFDARFQAEADKFRRKTAARADRLDYKYLLENLEKIEPKLERAGVFLGIENRDGLSELPLDWNLRGLFGKIGESKTVKFWHDVGHSKKKELKGLYRQEKLLDEMAEFTAGWHLHDCDEYGEDHKPIGEGRIDFAALKKYFDPKKHIFTIELGAKNRSARAADSLKRVQDMLA